MNIDWSKAPKWANAVIRSNVGGEFFVSQWGGISARLRVGSSVIDKDSADMIPPHNWVLVETRGAPWTGEGLPPVGTVCETNVEGEWETSTVLAHHRDMAIIHRFSNEHEANMYDPVGESQIRPVRTPEQIAADEREAGITQMRELIGSQNMHPFAELWDAGYRKQSSP